jgi:plasmid stability protein
MANLTIRDLPDTAKESLSIQAAKAGVSLESFVRGLLQKAAKARFSQPNNLLKLFQECFGPKQGVDLELSPAKTRRSIVEFD